MVSHERASDSPEKTVEFDGDELRKVFERTSEQAERSNEHQTDSIESRVEKARLEANKEALKRREDTPVKATTTTPKTIQRITKQVKEAEYKKTLKLIRADMKPSSRVFSKLIHNPIVEESSQIVGSTVARPNAILAGSLSALIITGVLYSISNYYDYSLSGFETIGAFIAGWVIGLIVDYIRITLLGKRAA